MRRGSCCVWLRDRIRTAINVLGDSYGAAVVAHLSSKELEADKHAPIEVPEDGPEDDEDVMELRENGKMDAKADEPIA